MGSYYNSIVDYIDYILHYITHPDQITLRDDRMGSYCKDVVDYIDLYYITHPDQITVTDDRMGSYYNGVVDYIDYILHYPPGSDHSER